MTIEEAEAIFSGDEPQDLSPDGFSDLSIPGTGYKMTIPSDNGKPKKKKDFMFGLIQYSF